MSFSFNLLGIDTVTVYNPNGYTLELGTSYPAGESFYFTAPANYRISKLQYDESEIKSGNDLIPVEISAAPPIDNPNSIRITPEDDKEHQVIVDIESIYKFVTTDTIESMEFTTGSIDSDNSLMAVDIAIVSSTTISEDYKPPVFTNPPAVSEGVAHLRADGIYRFMVTASDLETIDNIHYGKKFKRTFDIYSYDMRIDPTTGKYYGTSTQAKTKNYRIAIKPVFNSISGTFWVIAANFAGSFVEIGFTSEFKESTYIDGFGYTNAPIIFNTDENGITVMNRIGNYNASPQFKNITEMWWHGTQGVVNNYSTRRFSPGTDPVSLDVTIMYVPGFIPCLEVVNFKDTYKEIFQGSNYRIPTIVTLEPDPITANTLQIIFPSEDTDVTKGKFFQKTCTADDCSIVTWEVTTTMPGVTLSIVSGVITGIIPIDMPDGDYTITVTATNSIGQQRYKVFDVVLSEYDVGGSWEVLGSCPVQPYSIFQHSTGYYLIAGLRYIYKTTDFLTFTEVYDAGALGAACVQFYERSDNIVITCFQKTAAPYYNIFMLNSTDSLSTAFTETQILTGVGALSSMANLGLRLYVAYAASNRTYIAEVNISTLLVDPLLTVTGYSAALGGNGARIGSLYMNSSCYVATNKGTAGFDNGNDMYSVSFTALTTTYEGTKAGIPSTAYPILPHIFENSDNSLIALSNTTTLKSSDNGSTWEELKEYAVPLGTLDITRPILSRCSDDIYFVAESNVTNGKVWKSEDGGVTFSNDYTLTNSAKPFLMYKDVYGRILLCTTGTSNNILRSE